MTFIIGLDSFAISNTRALHDDTDYICVGFSVNGTKSAPIAHALGDVNNGFFKLDGLSFPLPETYNTADKFVFSFFLLNHGGSSKQDVLGRCLDAMTQTKLLDFNSGDAEPLANGLPKCLGSTLRAADDLQTYWDMIKSHFEGGNNWCDGPVAIDRVSFLGSSVDTIKLNFSQTPFSTNCLGIPSHNGCGSNSHYSIQWEMKEIADFKADAIPKVNKLDNIPKNIVLPH